MSVLDWVIVGGGAHGVCAARALKSVGAELRIVEPSGHLLARWLQRAGEVDMAWMRSPVTHHLDHHPSDLHHFLHDDANADLAQLAGKFSRPKHEAFVRHSRQLIARDGLQALVVEDRVESLERAGDHLHVIGRYTQLRARRVLVATGSNRPRFPPWAETLRKEGAAVEHVFEGSAALHSDIVGGGISAVQRCLKVRRTTRTPVRLWTRRPVELAEFDYDRALTRGRFLGRWSQKDDAERASFLQRELGGGSVPPALWANFSRAVRRGQVQVFTGPLSVERSGSGDALVITGPEGRAESTGVTLATGLARERLGGWLGRCAINLGLPTHAELPCLGEDMHWGHGVHVSGPLARLRLGPMAANLIGARWASSLLPGVSMMPY